MTLDWTSIGVQQMCVSDLIAKRINSTFTNLFINHTGFFVYFRSHMVLQFNAAYRTDTEQDLLYVTEDD
ncbi:hypothetical protein KOR34_22180 [Posidoniimonas corsicana]|uniref:Uncharacterized protein n=1 Tax=Posidoniimonas corsicana TaxID=1938618 RepID=A0A5C5VGP2_9BACT|nr:hypothetical protein KOR34_22180 [Posidoniimonas corsicana]